MITHHTTAPKPSGKISSAEWNEAHDVDLSDYGGSVSVGPGGALTLPAGEPALKQNGATMLYYNSHDWLQLAPDDGRVVLGGGKVAGADEFDIYVGSEVDETDAPTGPALRYSASGRWQFSDDGALFRSLSDIAAGVVPDPSGRSPGDVLTLDSSLVPTWEAPSGGDGDGEGEGEGEGDGGSPFAGHIEIDDADNNPYVKLLASGAGKTWYLEGQADGSLDFYGQTGDIDGVALKLMPWGQLKLKPLNHSALPGGDSTMDGAIGSGDDGIFYYWAAGAVHVLGGAGVADGGGSQVTAGHTSDVLAGPAQAGWQRATLPDGTPIYVPYWLAAT